MAEPSSTRAEKWVGIVLLSIFLLSISGCITGCFIAESTADRYTTERCIRAGGDHMVWNDRAADLCVSKDGRILFAN